MTIKILALGILLCGTVVANGGEQNSRASAASYLERGNAAPCQRKPGPSFSRLQHWEFSPNFAQVYFNRGSHFQDKGNLAEALLNYNIAIRLNPRLAEAYVNRGKVRQLTGDLDGAIADYNQALKLRPRFAKAFYNRGSVWLAQARLDRAIADFDLAIQYDSHDAMAFNNPPARQTKGDLTRGDS